MAASPATIAVYLETGQKRTFAGALDWPGWCRSGKEAEPALQALLDYGPRYASAIQPAKLNFQAPASLSTFQVVERLEGSQTTDFGAPAAIPAADDRPVEATDLQRFQALLKALWQEAAREKELRKGPRGGGRELEGVVRHVLEAEVSYLSTLGWKLKQSTATELGEMQAHLRQGILEGVEAAARGEIPAEGPRGGRRWPLRYYVRRAAWHMLDHAWELEDRIM
jgi:hypothetical protein